jgi:hypothetical protein
MGYKQKIERETKKRYEERQIDIEKQREGKKGIKLERERETETETDRQTDRQTEIRRETNRHRETEIEEEKDKMKEREREEDVFFLSLPFYLLLYFKNETRSPSYKTFYSKFTHSSFRLPGRFLNKRRIFKI